VGVENMFETINDALAEAQRSLTPAGRPENPQTA
jgi:hypothetical protein